MGEEKWGSLEVPWAENSFIALESINNIDS